MAGGGNGHLSQPLVFVHGAFCGGWAFDAFRAPFERAGFQTLAPDLPHHQPGADAAALSQSGLQAYVDALVAFCRTLPDPPILVGHSMGGLVAQIAASRTPVSSLILLAPSAPWGVLPTTLDEQGGQLGLAMLGDYWRRPVQPDYAVARHTALNRFDGATARQIFAKFVPESGRAMMEILHWWLDPFLSSAAPAYRISAPVLALAGGEDRVNPATTVKRIANRFPNGQSHFHPFAGMSHWLIEEPGWQDVADVMLRWLGDRSQTRTMQV